MGGWLVVLKIPIRFRMLFSMLMLLDAKFIIVMLQFKKKSFLLCSQGLWQSSNFNILSSPRFHQVHIRQVRPKKLSNDMSHDPCLIWPPLTPFVTPRGHVDLKWHTPRDLLDESFRLRYSNVQCDKVENFRLNWSHWQETRRNGKLGAK